MNENKRMFVEALGELLTKHDSRSDIDHFEYIKTEYDEEYVRVVFKNCYTKMVCVTFDSNLAIMLDVAKALCY